MKRTIWLVLAAAVSSGVMAQEVTNAPPAPAISNTPSSAEAPGTNAGASAKTNAPAATPKKTQKKKKAPPKRVITQTHTTPLVAGQAAIVASNVNVRGQAKLKSEVIAQVQKGQLVNVLEEVTLKNSGPDEPSAWARIILPANVHVWVNSGFISTNKTVIPKKLKLRGGPGENYSMLGIIKQGDEVKEVGAKGDWIQIEAPAEACGFVAAQYLTQEPAALATAQPPTATTVAENPPITPPPSEPPAVSPAVTNEPAVATTPAPATNETAVVEEPPPPRIVDREGFVRGTFSIQAPTKFELVSPDTGRVINYLYTAAPDLDLRRYKGMKIVVTGEEGLDERWRNTPIITIEKIHVLE